MGKAELMRHGMTKDPLEWLPLGWFVSSPIDAELLSAELQRELPYGHLLYHIPINVIAHREGTDDILCAHQGDPERFTVIHLTWIGRTEINSSHPTVESDGTFEDFLNYERRFGAP